MCPDANGAAAATRPRRSEKVLETFRGRGHNIREPIRSLSTTSRAAHWPHACMPVQPVASDAPPPLPAGCPRAPLGRSLTGKCCHLFTFFGPPGPDGPFDARLIETPLLPSRSERALINPLLPAILKVHNDFRQSIIRLRLKQRLHIIGVFTKIPMLDGDGFSRNSVSLLTLPFFCGPFTFLFFLRFLKGYYRADILQILQSVA